MPSCHDRLGFHCLQLTSLYITPFCRGCHNSHNNHRAILKLKFKKIKILLSLPWMPSCHDPLDIYCLQLTFLFTTPSHRGCHNSHNNHRVIFWENFFKKFKACLNLPWMPSCHKPLCIHCLQLTFLFTTLFCRGCHTKHRLIFKVKFKKNTGTALPYHECHPAMTHEAFTVSNWHFCL